MPSNDDPSTPNRGSTGVFSIFKVLFQAIRSWAFNNPVDLITNFSFYLSIYSKHALIYFQSIRGALTALDCALRSACTRILCYRLCMINVHHLWFLHFFIKLSDSHMRSFVNFNLSLDYEYCRSYGLLRTQLQTRLYYINKKRKTISEIFLFTDSEWAIRPGIIGWTSFSKHQFRMLGSRWWSLRYQHKL